MTKYIFKLVASQTDYTPQEDCPLCDKKVYKFLGGKIRGHWCPTAQDYIYWLSVEK